MNNIKKNWDDYSLFTKRTIKTITTLAAITAIYTSINVIVGTTIRPAWAWELQALTSQQLDTALQIERSDRREFSRDLSRFRAMRDNYIHDGKPIPVWLTDEISKGENDILKIDNKINSLQERIIANK